MAEAKQSIHDYDIVKQIGSGSFGVVYLVKAETNESSQIDAKSETLVMKQISLAKLDAKQRYDAHKEILLLSTLTHPNIVSYRHSFENDIQQLHIIMDYCDGGDLYRKVNDRKRLNAGPFEEQLLMQWFVQLCLALKYIHDKKILHRDLKTQNIFACDSDHVVKLGDFGIARILDHTADLAATCIGTPYYLSPEVCQNRPYGTKTDVWALGCVFYELATFRHPFEGRTLAELLTKIIKGTYEPVPCVYSPRFKQLISHMLKVNSTERPDVNGLLQRDYVYEYAHDFLKETKRLDELSTLENLMKDKQAAMNRKIQSARHVGVIANNVKRPGAYTGTLHKPPMSASKRAHLEKKFRMYMLPAGRNPIRKNSAKNSPRKSAGGSPSKSVGSTSDVPADPVPTEKDITPLVATQVVPKSDQPDQPKSEAKSGQQDQQINAEPNLNDQQTPEKPEPTSDDPNVVQSLGSTIIKPKKHERKKWAALRPPPEIQQPGTATTTTNPHLTQKVVAPKIAFQEIRTKSKWKGVSPALPSIPGSVDNEWSEEQSRICETCGCFFVVPKQKRKTTLARNQCQACKLAEKNQTKVEAVAGKSVFEKIECLRQELEQRLGLEKFTKAYRMALGMGAIGNILDEDSKAKLEKLIYFEKAYLS